MTVGVGDLLRVSTRFKHAVTGDVVNVWHLIVTSGADTSDDDCFDDIEAFMDTLWSGINASLPNGMDPYDIRIDEVEMAGGVEHVVRTLGTRTWTLTTPPSSAGEYLPPMDAAIINFRTLIPKVFGRKYIGILTEAAATSGVLSGVSLTNMLTFATAIVNGFNGTTLTYKFGVMTNKDVVNGFTELTAAVVNTILGTQRRRRQGRGG